MIPSRGDPPGTGASIELYIIGTLHTTSYSINVSLWSFPREGNLLSVSPIAGPNSPEREPVHFRYTKLYAIEKSGYHRCYIRNEPAGNPAVKLEESFG
jgi:hypothetical protein